MTSRKATVQKNEEGFIPLVVDKKTRDIIWRGDAESTKAAAFTVAESKINDQKKLKEFQNWMAEVDAVVGEYREMSVFELAPDAPFSVWFEEGKPAIEAAAWAIESAG